MMRKSPGEVHCPPPSQSYHRPSWYNEVLDQTLARKICWLLLVQLQMWVHTLEDLVLMLKWPFESLAQSHSLLVTLLSRMIMPHLACDGCVTSNNAYSVPLPLLFPVTLHFPTIVMYFSVFTVSIAP